MHDPEKRVNLVSLRTRLETTLGASHGGREQFSLYWDYLRKYVQSKLSKRELDHFARKILGETNIFLHNMFIQAIISNARSPHLPDIPKIRMTYIPPSVSTIVPAPKSQHPLRKKSPPKPHGPHFKNLIPTRGTKIVPVTMPLLGPEYTVLCARLQKLVMEAGLSGITQDAIQYMMLAIETYIKQMVQNAKPLSQKLSVNNLYKTTILHPSLFGEDFLLHQEQLSLSLM